MIMILSGNYDHQINQNFDRQNLHNTRHHLGFWHHRNHGNERRHEHKESNRHVLCRHGQPSGLHLPHHFLLTIFLMTVIIILVFVLTKMFLAIIILILALTIMLLTINVMTKYRPHHHAKNTIKA